MARLYKIRNKITKLTRFFNFQGGVIASYKQLQGSRLAIDEYCPTEIRKLIQNCWEIQADRRDPISIVLSNLIAFYIKNCK